MSITPTHAEHGPPHDLAPNPRASATSAHRRNIAMLAATLGTVVEYADWLIYATLASQFSLHFFPSSDPTTSLLSTFAVFAVGFVMRPIGGAVTNEKQGPLEPVYEREDGPITDASRSRTFGNSRTRADRRGDRFALRRLVSMTTRAGVGVGTSPANQGRSELTFEDPVAGNCSRCGAARKCDPKRSGAPNMKCSPPRQYHRIAGTRP